MRQVLVLMRCTHVTKLESGGEVGLVMNPQVSQFFEATPCGDLDMSVLNDSALEQFVPGEDYEVTIKQVSSSGSGSAD